LEIVSVKLNPVSAGSEDFVADDGYVFQRFDATGSCADFGCRGNPAFRDDGLSRRNEMGRISLSCNLSLAPGFSPVGAGDEAPSRFNGLVAAGAENG
jgi:hypothetical protein